MAFSPVKLLFLLLLLSPIFITSTSALNSSATLHLSSIKNFCKTRPYPDACFNSLKLSISINITPNILTYLLHTLQTAISDAVKLTTLLSNTGTGGSNTITEKQRGSIQDCKELHQITLSSLQKSVPKIQSGDSRNLADARTYLSAALTNKNTCLEGLDSASGPLKPVLIDSVVKTYEHVSNSLSMLPRVSPGGDRKNRRLLGFPRWVSKKDRRLLQSDDDDEGDEYDASEIITVAADGSGNFSTIFDAINYAPNNSVDRVIILVREGRYSENVEIPSYKMNIVLIGDGSDVTFITGKRSVADGWTTFRSATLAISGEGFLARDISIENTAGAKGHQAAAVRINADLTAMYRCTITGYQDTLYAHSFRQFYRQCDIYGTIDYIFGNAAAVFQTCNLVSLLPLPGQYTVITAQSRESPDQDTGISIQNCTILASDDLYSNSKTVKSYLGRPWRPYSRTVIMESYIDDFIDPTGWSKWSEDVIRDGGLDSLYYGEYDNSGGGSVTDGRVDWVGFHVMDYYDAFNFSVAYFISGDQWLDSTSFPYYDGI
ncbi:probable pectinesterase/pectinesterase inhibitor 12 [Euphorbia lathyris]|uniref:probable pectinesterase/pectinesterase inhibitor 12 n=1 Tax=Euphorbia lathyris TaxID=212925 RepID=UPI0033137BE8